MIVNSPQPVTYQYDPASRLTWIAQDALFVALGYDDYDANANLLSVTGGRAADDQLLL